MAGREVERPAALAPTVPVGAPVERVAPPSAEHTAAENAADTAPVSKPTPATAAAGLAELQGRDCLVRRDERRREAGRPSAARQPSVYERRPDSTESAPEVAEYTDGAFVALLDAVSTPLLNVVPPAPRKSRWAR